MTSKTQDKLKLFNKPNKEATLLLSTFPRRRLLAEYQWPGALMQSILSDDGDPDIPRDPLIGHVLGGRYRLDAILGKGGFGTVYRGTQLNVDRPVAIKILHGGVTAESDVARRFVREAKIISELRHPHTLRLYDHGETDSRQFYLVTEFLDGRPLDEHLKVHGRLSPIRTLQILEQVCGALIEAHEKGIIHRDLKPANLFIEEVGGEWMIKVIDFGIARVSNSSVQTQTGALFGTPAYMSPEQAKGEKTSLSTDLYSLGVIAFECLTGGLPFTGENPLSVLIKHMTEAPPLFQLDEIKKTAPCLSSLIIDLMAKLPTDRPTDANDLRQRVRDCMKALERPPPQSRRSFSWVGFLLLLVIVSTFGVLQWLQAPSAGVISKPDSMPYTLKQAILDANISQDLKLIRDASLSVDVKLVEDATDLVEIEKPSKSTIQSQKHLSKKHEKNKNILKNTHIKLKNQTEDSKQKHIEIRVIISPSKMVYSVYSSPRISLIDVKTQAVVSPIKLTLVQGADCARLDERTGILDFDNDAQECQAKIRACYQDICEIKQVIAMRSTSL